VRRYEADGGCGLLLALRGREGKERNIDILEEEAAELVDD